VYFEGDNYSRIDPGDLTNTPTIYNQSNTWTGANAFSAVSTPSVDTASATTLTLGGTNANQITIGKAAGTPATIRGALTVTGLTTNTGGIATTSVDTASVVPLNVGTTNTSLLNLGKVGTLVDVMGNLSIDGNLTTPINPSYSYNSLTGTGVSGTIGHIIRGTYGTTTGMTSSTNHVIANLTIDSIGVWALTGQVGFRCVTTPTTLYSFMTQIRQGASTVIGVNSYSNNNTGTTPINTNYFVAANAYVVNTVANTAYTLNGQVNALGSWNTNGTNFYFYAVRIA